MDMKKNPNKLLYNIKITIFATEIKSETHERGQILCKMSN